MKQSTAIYTEQPPQQQKQQKQEEQLQQQSEEEFQKIEEEEGDEKDKKLQWVDFFFPVPFFFLLFLLLLFPAFSLQELQIKQQNQQQQQQQQQVGGEAVGEVGGVLQDLQHFECDRNSLSNVSPEEESFITTTLTRPHSPIGMTAHEYLLLWRYQQVASVYYEFGSGGSTILAGHSPTIQKITTVETNLTYFQELLISTSLSSSSSSSSSLLHAYQSGKLSLRFVAVAPSVDGWGNPQDESLKWNWPFYSQSLLESYTTEIEVMEEEEGEGAVEEEGEKVVETGRTKRRTRRMLSSSSSSSSPDLILVDGRFRLASSFSALQLFLLQTQELRKKKRRREGKKEGEGGGGGGDDGREGLLLIHDFFPRPHYYPILHYTDVVDCVGSLIVLRLKYSIDEEEEEEEGGEGREEREDSLLEDLHRQWEQYQYIFE